MAETSAICERMRELGIIVQPTGDRMNVLKMKPPMCLSVTAADFFCRHARAGTQHRLVTGHRKPGALRQLAQRTKVQTHVQLYPGDFGVARVSQKLRIALLSYRSKTHCGGRGRLRAPSQPQAGRTRPPRRGSSQARHYPGGLDDASCCAGLSLDLYREPDPFRVPRPSEIRDGIDLLELLTMWTAGFRSPHVRIADRAHLADRQRDRPTGSTSCTTTRAWAPVC